MSKCPHCFRALPPDRYVFACRSGKCTPNHDAEASAFHGASISTPPLRVLTAPENARRGWTPGQSVHCAACGGPTYEACPWCHYWLLEGWRHAEVTCLAMAGARATGKSFYIAVAVKQLERLAEQMNVALQPATQQTQRSYTERYEKPLYEDRGIIPPTPPATTADSYQRHPLIFSLGMRDGRRTYLVLRDVAGEDLENHSTDAFHLQFFAHASAVVFLFDPLWVPEVYGQLQGLLPHQLFRGGDPRKVLANVLRLIDSGRPRLAVTISKFDALQALRRVEGTDWSRVMSNAGAAFQRDPGLAPEYDYRDGELLHHEVRSLLQRLHAGAVVAAVENPHTGEPLAHRFFAVSALGESAEGERLHDRGISPFRCLDPIRWAMQMS
ncbi:MAG: TRAFAC clade GTPase domain-containing protein [Actinomycetes bacterium]